jgi:hypothetical protein
MSPVEAIRRWAILVAGVAALACAIFAASAAADEPAEPPADALRRCTAPKKLEPLVAPAWCKVVLDDAGMQECTGAAFPADDSMPFPAGCTLQYRRLHAACAGAKVQPSPQSWLCRRFAAAWTSKRTPELTGEVSDAGGAPLTDPGLATPPSTEAGTDGEDGDTPGTDDTTTPDIEGSGLVGGGPSNALTGTSDFCRRSDLDAAARARCQAAGSISRSYPLWNYGIDNQIRGNPIEVGKNVSAAMNFSLSGTWAMLLFAINGVLLMLDWAFSFDLVNRSMAGIAQGLYNLNVNVLGSWWMSLGIAGAALTGIWNGLVRMRTTQTMVGLAATVGLMVVAMLIIHEPQGTVGDLSKTVDEASLSAWSVAAKGSVKEPSSAFADSSRQVFDTLVLRPWCALQFGDIDFCLKKITKTCRIEERSWSPDSDPICDVKGETIADAWLSTPAGSKKRREMWVYLNEKDKSHAEMMGSPDGVVMRYALLFLIAGGMVGAILLVGGLALALLAAAIEALFLLLISPVMLIVPAFGDPGRRAMVTYLRRFGGVIVRKFIYAIGLAVVMLIATVISGLPNMSFGANWLLLFVFWWGVLIRRRQLFDFLTPGNGNGNAGMYALARMYMGYRVAASAVQTGTRATQGVMGIVRRRRGAVTGALASDARGELASRGRGALALRKGAELQRAAGIAAQARGARGRLALLDREQAERGAGLRLARERATVAGADLRTAERGAEQLDRERAALVGEGRRLDMDVVRNTADRDAERAQLQTPGNSPARQQQLAARIAAYDKKIAAAQQRRTEVDNEISTLDARRIPAAAAAVSAAQREVRDASADVAAISSEITTVGLQRGAAREALNAPEIRAAESLVSRQGGTPVEVSEREVRDWEASVRSRLAQTPAAADTQAMANDRRLIQRIDAVDQLSSEQVDQAVHDVRRHPQRGADFDRDVRARRRRRGVR